MATVLLSRKAKLLKARSYAIKPQAQAINLTLTPSLLNSTPSGAVSDEHNLPLSLPVLSLGE